MLAESGPVGSSITPRSAAAPWPRVPAGASIFYLGALLTKAGRFRPFPGWQDADAGRLLRTGRTGIDPRVDQLAKNFLCSRSRISAFARLPAPSNQIIACGVFLQQGQVATAVALLVFELTANVPHRFPLPCHLDGR